MRSPAVRLVVCCAMLAACSDDGGVRTNLSQLSSRGLYSDIAARKVVPEAFEYRPDYALWSDGADKRRWIVLPEGTEIDSSDMAHWVFPLGTKFFKEFSRKGKKLETRLVERVKETGFLKNDYFMGTFIWRADQSDAILTAEGRDNVLGTEHDVPRQKDCMVCHQGEPGGVLGFSAVQLSASGTLAKVERKGWLSENPGRVFELPGDEVQKSALGAMHANCGHCHADLAMADFMHLRFLPGEADRKVEELEAYRTTVGVELSDEWEDHPERFTTRVVPGDPDASAIAYRMGVRGDDEIVADQMPPLASRKVDEKGLAAVRKWIESLAGVEIDGGISDAGVGDAGEGDAGASDAGTADAAVSDAGVGDAGSGPAADGGRAGASGSPVGAGATGAAAGGGASGSGGPVGPADENPPVVQPSAAGEGASGAGAGGAAGGTAGTLAGGAGAEAAAGSGASGAAGASGESAGSAASGAAGASGETAGSGASGAAGVSGETAGSGASGGAGVSGETAGVGAPTGGVGEGAAGSGTLDDAGVSVGVSGSGGSGVGGAAGVGQEGGAAASGSAASGGQSGSGDRDVSVDEAAEHDRVAGEQAAAAAPDVNVGADEAEAADEDTSADEAADHDAHADEGAHGHG